MKLVKAMTLSEIVALTLITGFIGYRTYQIMTDKDNINTKILQYYYETNTPYLNSIYDSKERLR